MSNSNSNQIKIVLADDQDLFRECLSSALATSDPQLRIIGQAEDGNRLLELVREIECDVILLDINMPGPDSLDTLKTLKIEFPDIPVLMLSSQPEEKFGPRFLKAGASGYFCKLDPLDQLIGSIRKVFNGKLAISPSLSDSLAMESLRPNKTPSHEILSDREFQVMVLMSSGKKLSEVARELNLSPKTVSTYRCQLMQKMGWKNNAEMMRYSIKHELID